MSIIHGHRFKDLSGQRFGNVTVLGYSGKNKHGISLWECQCECGNKLITHTKILRRGAIKACDCNRYQAVKVGERYARLLVKKLLGYGRGRELKWLCLCDCGNETEVYQASLRSGTIRSCGCLLKESITKHGMDNTPTHYTWRCMTRRCGDPNNVQYHRYGAKGIQVCDRWKHFPNFLADMGVKPEGTSLDRYPDKNGNYEPGNCRWATPTEQSNNKTTNVLIEYKGETKTASEWARIAGISKTTISKRLKKGWSPDKILSSERLPRK